MQCRLLQAPATLCAECGAPMVAPVELVRELLHYRNMRFASNRDLGVMTAILAGGAFASPLLIPFAVATGVAFVAAKLRGGGRRRRIAGVALPAMPPPRGATTMYGVARKLRSTVDSLLDGAPVVLEHAVIRDGRGAVLLRRTFASPFLLETDAAPPLLVAGIARVTPSVLAHTFRVKGGDARLARMGVPDDFGVAGELTIASVPADGPMLAVTGLLGDESVAELAFHRDGGRAPVMRGSAGAPVLVSDRRMIAAAL
ncbi:MAG TPA: hypothetical protein VGM88_14735 [Kofleriaceae bacterium]